MKFHTKIILHPTDFSANAAKSLRFATDFLLIPKTRFIIYHVCELPFFTKPPTADELAVWQHESMHAASENMQAYLHACFGDQEPKPLPEREIAVNGSAYKSILDIITRLEPYLVVMGQKGKTALHGSIIGSNSRHILEKSPCPVLLVPDQMEEETKE
jgi:nucleotide-binding universal stress UspA family protein